MVNSGVSLMIATRTNDSSNGGKNASPSHAPLHTRQIKIRTARQGLLINLCAATNENVCRKVLRVQLIERVENEDVVCGIPIDFRKVQLVGAFQMTAPTPFMVFAEHFRMSVNQVLRMARENQALAIRQRLANRFKRLAAHHHDVAAGHLFEPLEVFGQVPRDFVPVSDDAIFAHRRDGFEVFHAQRTAEIGCGLPSYRSGSRGRARTYNHTVNSRVLYH